ncbi:AraC family transcriptional regulator [Pseudoduganella sp. LjRoot289]|uniref:helix-turn-helix transcriptional regulator n=1 Tax=Pseudoduganella sp. LjRoot289 TaxID=3342314 RepID=UPI003ECF12D1
MKTDVYMQELIEAAKKTLNEEKQLPFSVYSSITEQHILNAPVIRPLLIFVLAGVKQLGRDSEIVCPSGGFVFLSNSPTIDMRNIPDDEEYFAVLVEFDHSDFDQFKNRRNSAKKYVQGEIAYVLAKTLQQYMEWSTYAHPEAWHFRRKELLQIIFQLGHEDVSAIAEHPSLSHQVHDLISSDIAGDWGVERLTSKLALSESTFRRKLKAEGTDINAIVNRTRLGHGLHLVQTTMEPIGRIAERCGYISQSRFTDKFKKLFGLTPSELRKTRMHD